MSEATNTKQYPATVLGGMSETTSTKQYPATVLGGMSDTTSTKQYPATVLGGMSDTTNTKQYPATVLAGVSKKPTKNKSRPHQQAGIYSPTLITSHQQFLICKNLQIQYEKFSSLPVLNSTSRSPPPKTQPISTASRT